MADEIEQYLVAKLTEAIKDVKASDQHLPAKLAHLSSKFEHLKKSLEPISPSETSNPLKLSREKLYTLNNLLSEWQMQSKKNTPYCLDSLFFTYKFATILDKIKGELLQAGVSNGESTRQSDHESSSGDEFKGYRWSDRWVDETKVHGLNDKAMYFQRLLVPRKDDSWFKMIGIVGKRGIGKTTLCQVIFNKQEVRNHFVPRIWVCVSKQQGAGPDNRKEIVKRILESLGVEEAIIKSANDRHGLKGLLYALQLQLKGKRYVIVLDDVWSTYKQYKDFCSFCSCLALDEKCSEKLAYGLPKGSGGAVIVTSWNEELVMEMVGEENLHPILPLSDSECIWSIFKDSFGHNDKHFEGLKEKIVEKCDGLPLAAKMIGQIAHEQLPRKPAVPESHQKECQQELQQPTK